MKFYCAGKFQEAGIIRSIMEGFRKRGHEITSDWTYDDPDAEGKALKFIADTGLQGLRNCEALLVVAVNDWHYKGAIGEFVSTLVDRKPTYMIGHGLDECIFTNSTALYRFETLSDFWKFEEDYLRNPITSGGVR